MAQYDIIKSLSETTSLAESDGRIYVLKKIGLEDTEMYKKIMSINHPNLVRIIELTTLGSDFYAVENYVQGVTLEKYAEQAGGLSVDETRRITADICSGVQPLHEKNVVHRDLTPQNIMITDEGRAVIIDFGISRIKKLNRNADTQILGTQGFAAPEQFGFSQTDSRADVYSIGVLMNYMQTLALPQEKYAGGELGKIIVKCVSPDADDRYQSVADLKKAVTHRGKLTAFLYAIPGFRTGVWWREFIAVFYYLFAVLIVAVNINDMFKKNIFIILLQSIGLIIIFLSPPLIIFNFAHWLDRWHVTKYASAGKRAAFIILFLFLFSLLGCIFISIN